MTFSCKPLNTVTSKQLFTLLRAALWHETPSDDFIHDLSADSWQKIYKVATSQGVLAIAWDGLEQLIAEGLIPQERQPPLQLKIQWAYNVEQIENVRQNKFGYYRNLPHFTTSTEFRPCFEGLRRKPGLPYSGSSSLRRYRHMAFRAARACRRPAA